MHTVLVSVLRAAKAGKSRPFVHAPRLGTMGGISMAVYGKHGVSRYLLDISGGWFDKLRRRSATLLPLRRVELHAMTVIVGAVYMF